MQRRMRASAGEPAWLYWQHRVFVPTQNSHLELLHVARQYVIIDKTADNTTSDIALAGHRCRYASFKASPVG